MKQMIVGALISIDNISIKYGKQEFSNKFGIILRNSKDAAYKQFYEVYNQRTAYATLVPKEFKLIK